MTSQQGESGRWEGASQEKKKEAEGSSFSSGQRPPEAEPSPVGWVKKVEGGAVEQLQQGLK